MRTAYTTIKGFEAMRALRKGQAAIFNLTRDIVGEARLVERAFGLGPCTLTEAVLSEEEFFAWQRAFDAYGLRALRTTRIQSYRDLSSLRPFKRR
jgi:hypothetical protein